MSKPIVNRGLYQATVSTLINKSKGRKLPRTLITLTALTLLAISPSLTSAASVSIVGGDVIIVDNDGHRRALTSNHNCEQPVLSPDSRLVAYVCMNLSAGISTLWLGSEDGKPIRPLLASSPSNTPENNLTEFNNLVFSPDSQQLYLLTEAWATSNALHRIDLTTGKQVFVTDANSVEVVSKGKYAGYLIVQKHQYLKQGGSSEYYWLISRQGKLIKNFGEHKEAISQFLR
jgi:hypothetical protein